MGEENYVRAVRTLKTQEKANRPADPDDQEVMSLYLKTKDTYAEWKRSGYSQAFYTAHEQEIIIHKAAKKAFDAMGGKIPSIRTLNAEYKDVLSKKQRDFASYRTSRDETRELLNVKANIDLVTERSERQQRTKDLEIG